jgi:hypothetical protein
MQISSKKKWKSKNIYIYIDTITETEYIHKCIFQRKWGGTPPLTRNCEREESVSYDHCPALKKLSARWEGRRMNSPQARKLWYTLTSIG